MAISPPKQVILWFLKAYFFVFCTKGKTPEKPIGWIHEFQTHPPFAGPSVNPQGGKGGGKSFPQNHPHLTSARHGWKEDSLFSNLWITIAMCFYWERLCAKWVPWFCWRLIYPQKRGVGVPSLRFRPLGIIYFKCPSLVIFSGPWIMKISGSRFFTKNSVNSCFKNKMATSVDQPSLVS